MYAIYVLHMIYTVYLFLILQILNEFGWFTVDVRNTCLQLQVFSLFALGKVPLRSIYAGNWSFVVAVTRRSEGHLYWRWSNGACRSRNAWKRLPPSRTTERASSPAITWGHNNIKISKVQKYPTVPKRRRRRRYVCMHTGIYRYIYIDICIYIWYICIYICIYVG